MGYLLKEALKTLCGVNQWAYAIFWKIGCQNPRLLIWEECYYESASCSNLNHEISLKLQCGVRAQDKVHMLVDKMMVDNHFNIVGEGLVGRAAFTGNYHWILSENYNPEEHPPEVLKEVCQQFAASMKTIAVIPALPHGVVQFGSFSTIMENPEFVKEVSSLVLELGYVSGALLSGDIAAKEHDPRIGVSAACLGNSSSGNVTLKPNVASLDGFNCIGNSSETCFSAMEILNRQQSSSAPFHISNSIPNNFSLPGKLEFSAPYELVHSVAKAEVIPSNLERWMCQHSSTTSRPKILSNTRSVNTGIQTSVPETDIKTGHVTSSVDSPAASSFVSMDRDTGRACDAPLSRSYEYANSCEFVPGVFKDDSKSESGNDLFDVLGADFKNKIFSRYQNDYSSNNFNSTMDYDSEIYCASKANSKSGVLSEAGTDNLLEAVVTKVHPSMDDSVSTLTSTPNASLPYSRFGITDQMKVELFGLPKHPEKSALATSSCSFVTTASKEELGTYSQGSSIYGSQISSWILKNQKAKPSNTASTGYSKKPDTANKTTRRRLKSGENPRPRPKDRQMIQDRVKELREIVPNGAKCSIDSLLERTIKHMLFLQSVAKHADRLKQTGESKIISKNGDLLLKDGFEGGATWAYEVGSQPMVCPIIVEDLNEPRQMLIEMLCEDRGLFLEIADIVRGLGLTILKGVMETRDKNIWARFVVEANRDVTRMEIFLSLVRLLEPSSETQQNGVANRNTMLNHQYCRSVSCVPVVAGGSHGLQ